MEVIKDIAAIIGCLLSLISLIALCSKGGRAFISRIFSKNTKDLHEENERQTKDIEEIKTNVSLLLSRFYGVEEVSKQQCRIIIKDLYYQYEKEQTIPLYARKIADNTFHIYHDIFHGNSYITLLYNEICKWPIDHNTHRNLEEE